ncbi:MAG: hypothetical protein JTJ18_02215 [Streptococcus sp.]|nr:hypothetical protein [Streptococcus sp.]
MMMKKWISLALLGLASASLLVACGSKKEESKSSAKEAQTTVKSSQKKAKASSGKKETKTAEASAASSATTTAPTQAQAQAQTPTQPSQGNSANQAGTTTSKSDPKTGYGGWEATSGTLELLKDTPVYASPDKSSGVAYVQPQANIEWDNYMYENGEWWYSFVQKNRDQEVRYYIAYSDVGY